MHLGRCGSCDARVRARYAERDYFHDRRGRIDLGGGIGHLTRKCGLTIDNLLSADVVLADGKFVKAKSCENSDLFWALRGGGGNFGVVTSFTFKLHTIDTVYGGPILYELSEAAEVMKWYRELIPTAPDD